MKQLIDTPQKMSSREIAQLTSKEHRTVLRDIDNLNSNYEKLGLHKVVQSSYLNEQGRKFRQYELTKMQTLDLLTGYNAELRIKVNRRWEELESKVKEIDFSNPNTVLQLAKNWAESEKKRLDAENKVKILQPKAELMDKVLDAEEKIDIGQASKILELPFGRNTMFRKLREKGIFFKNRNEPKQEYIKRQYFVLKEKYIARNNHDGFVVVKVLVTQKGLEFLSNQFHVAKSNKQLAMIK